MAQLVAFGPTTNYAAASGSVFFNDAVTTVTQIKATKGSLYLLDLMNGTAATAYLQIFYKPSASVTLGTTTADFTIKLPTNAGSGFTKTICFPVPIGGSGTGLSIAGTTTPTGSSTAAIGVSAEFI